MGVPAQTLQDIAAKFGSAAEMKAFLKKFALGVLLALPWIGAATAAETDNYFLNFTGNPPYPPSAWTPTTPSPLGQFPTRQDPTPVFYEDWSSGAIDTTTNWNAASTGGGGSSTPSSGAELLGSGTTANGFADLTSKKFFQPVAPGWLLFDHQMQLPASYPAHTYAFWGAARLPGSPTATTPVTQGVGFLINTTGQLAAVSYATNTLNTIAVLSAITDGAVHRYQAYIRGDIMYWSIDGLTVANIQTGALGPDNNNLAVAMLTGVDATGATTQMTLNSAAAFLGDTTKSGVSIAPTASPNFGIIGAPSAAAEASHVFKAAPGNLYGIYVSNPSASGFLMVFNSTTVPGDGAVTPIECVPVSASNVAFVNYIPGPPEVYSTGISAALSSTGCFTKTTSPTGFFHGSVQ